MWLRNRPGRALDEKLEPELFHVAYSKAETLDIAANGFLKCGLVSYNPYIFTEDSFKAANMSGFDPELLVTRTIHPQLSAMIKSTSQLAVVTMSQTQTLPPLTQKQASRVLQWSRMRPMLIAWQTAEVNDGSSTGPEFTNPVALFSNAGQWVDTLVNV